MAKKIKYETHIEPKLEKIYQLVASGKTREDVANYLKMSRRTLYRYMDKHQELKKIMDQGDVHSCDVMEGFLFKQAEGFYYYEEAITPKGEKVELKKYCKPNVTAIIFYLKNKDPKRWSDKHQIDQNINQNLVLFSNPEDLPE